MNSEYHIQYQSPFGTGNGTFVLTDADNGLTGKLTVFNKQFLLGNGKKNKNEFSFEGKIAFMGTQIPYQVKGMINANALNATVHTKFGDITATGIQK